MGKKEILKEISLLKKNLEKSDYQISNSWEYGKNEKFMTDILPNLSPELRASLTYVIDKLNKGKMSLPKLAEYVLRDYNENGEMKAIDTEEEIEMSKKNKNVKETKVEAEVFAEPITIDDMPSGLREVYETEEAALLEARREKEAKNKKDAKNEVKEVEELLHPESKSEIGDKLDAIIDTVNDSIVEKEKLIKPKKEEKKSSSLSDKIGDLVDSVESIVYTVEDTPKVEEEDHDRIASEAAYRAAKEAFKKKEKAHDLNIEKFNKAWDSFEKKKADLEEIRYKLSTETYQKALKYLANIKKQLMEVEQELSEETHKLFYEGDYGKIALYEMMSKHGATWSSVCNILEPAN